MSHMSELLRGRPVRGSPRLKRSRSCSITPARGLAARSAEVENRRFRSVQPRDLAAAALPQHSSRGRSQGRARESSDPQQSLPLKDTTQRKRALSLSNLSTRRVVTSLGPSQKRAAVQDASKEHASTSKSATRSLTPAGGDQHDSMTTSCMEIASSHGVVVEAEKKPAMSCPVSGRVVEWLKTASPAKFIKGDSSPNFRIRIMFTDQRTVPSNKSALEMQFDMLTRETCLLSRDFLIQELQLAHESKNFGTYQQKIGRPPLYKAKDMNPYNVENDSLRKAFLDDLTTILHLPGGPPPDAWAVSAITSISDDMTSVSERWPDLAPDVHAAQLAWPQLLPIYVLYLHRRVRFIEQYCRKKARFVSAPSASAVPIGVTQLLAPLPRIALVPAELWESPEGDDAAGEESTATTQQEEAWARAPERGDAGDDAAAQQPADGPASSPDENCAVPRSEQQRNASRGASASAGPVDPVQKPTTSPTRPLAESSPAELGEIGSGDNPCPAQCVLEPMNTEQSPTGSDGDDWHRFLQQFGSDAGLGEIPCPRPSFDGQLSPTSCRTTPQAPLDGPSDGAKERCVLGPPAAVPSHTTQNAHGRATLDQLHPAPEATDLNSTPHQGASSAALQSPVPETATDTPPLGYVTGAPDSAAALPSPSGSNRSVEDTIAAAELRMQRCLLQYTQVIPSWIQRLKARLESPGVGGEAAQELLALMLSYAQTQETFLALLSNLHDS